MKETLALENEFYHFIDSIYRRAFRVTRSGNISEQLKINLEREINRPTNQKRFNEITNKVYEKAMSDALRLVGKYANTYASTPLPLTKEAIRVTQELGDNIRASILRMLEENKLYTAPIPELAKSIEEFYERNRYRATRFARTFVNTVYNNTHSEVYKKSGVVKYVQFTAYLDSRTSDICRMMHGTIIDVERADLMKPPLHFNCRSRLIPYFGEVKRDLLWDYRDFTKPVDMKYKRTTEVFDYEKLQEEMNKMRVFRRTWSIPNFVLDSDVQRRLLYDVGLAVRFEEIVQEIKEKTDPSKEVMEKFMKKHKKELLEENLVMRGYNWEELEEKLSPQGKEFVKRLVKFNREKAKEWFRNHPEPLIRTLESGEDLDIIEFNRKLALKLMKEKGVKEITRYETNKEVYRELLEEFEKAIERTEKGNKVEFLTIKRLKNRVSCFTETEEMDDFNMFDVRYRTNVNKFKDDIVLHYQGNYGYAEEREVTVWIRKPTFSVDEIEVGIDDEWFSVGDLLEDETHRNIFKERIKTGKETIRKYWGVL